MGQEADIHDNVTGIAKRTDLQHADHLGGGKDVLGRVDIEGAALAIYHGKLACGRHLLIDSGRFGVEESAKILVEAASYLFKDQ